MFWMEIAGIESMSVARKGSTLGNSSFFATYLLFNLFFAIYSFSVIKKLKQYQDMIITRNKEGFIVISDIIGNRLVTKMYLYYTESQAIKRFIAEMKDNKSQNADISQAI